MHESEVLQTRLAEANAQLAAAEAELTGLRDVLSAIQAGDVDALVVPGPEGDRIFTLQEGEYAYRALVEAMNEGAAIVSHDDTVLYCNHRLADLFQLPLEQIIGSPATRIVAEELKPELEALLARARGIETGKIDSDFEAGAEIAVNISLRAMKTFGPGALCKVVTDITARKANELKMMKLAAFMHSIIASSPFATIVSDLQGTITSVNPAAERMLWYRKEELVGAQTPMVLLDGQAVARRASVLSAELNMPIAPGLEVLTANPQRGLLEESEWKLVRRDGSTFDAQLTVSALTNAGGDVVGHILIAYDITERKRAQEYISHLAHHDSLTGLPTRTLLHDRLNVALLRARRYGRKVALLMVDLDNFKRVNDLLGHLVGDELLIVVAKRLINSVRSSDTVARMGGDEFIVLLDELHTAQDAERIGEKLRVELTAPVTIGSHVISPTASVGICVFPDNGETAEALLKNADAAMYQAKAEGRNRQQSFTHEMAFNASRKRQLEIALSHALSLNEFELVYQPQISLKTGKVTGIEALLRWRSGKFGMVMPTEFITLAEESGLIVPIGEWVLRTACQEGMRLRRELGRDLTIAVNVSPRQFQQNNLPQVIGSVLSDFGVDPSTLELEITENILVGDLPRPMSVLEKIRSLGVHISIDDFGTGFSSMSYILRFRVDRLKIDQSFVRRMAVDPDSCAITNAVIALARGLNIPVVAEGIETAAHRDLLAGEGCDEGQGYFYSRPVPMGNLPAVIVTIEAAGLPVAVLG